MRCGLGCLGRLAWRHLQISSAGAGCVGRLRNEIPFPPVQAKDMDKLNALGGVPGLATAICSNPHNGLDPAAKGGSPESVEEHSRVFGANKYREVPSKNFFALCYENMKDPIILLLVAAALVRAGRSACVGRRAAARTQRQAPRGGSSSKRPCRYSSLTSGCT